MIIKQLVSSDANVIKKVICEMNSYSKYQYDQYLWQQMADVWVKELESAIFEEEKTNNDSVG